jgi:hypothetical protein
MTPVVLKPCPFCEGPPVPITRFSDRAGNRIADANIPESEDGLHSDAFVFCHECGGEGPHAHGIVFDRQDLAELTAKAVQQWNARDDRNRDLYDSNSVEGRCRYPRGDVIEVSQGGL